MTQPVYNVYHGMGRHITMTYRVMPGADFSEFLTAAGWQTSLVEESSLRGSIPLVAKNVRFKK